MEGRPDPDEAATLASMIFYNAITMRNVEPRCRPDVNRKLIEFQNGTDKPRPLPGMAPMYKGILLR